jgi:glycosyltransferase involved in cell wall biosynthesis
VRILVVSNFYPPVHFGGYELDCEQVVDSLRETHEVMVLASHHRAGEVGPEAHVLRVLPFGAHAGRPLDILRAPFRSLRAARRAVRVADRFRPDLVFIWNGTQIPQAVLWKLERCGAPVAYRVCEHWFARLYRTDEFMQFLLPGWAGPKALWSAFARAVNRHPALRIDLGGSVPAAVAWVSHALRETTPRPAGLDIYEERVIYIGVPQRPASSALRDRPFTIGFVGRISPEKGPDVAIRAVHRLRTNSGCEAELILAGHGAPAYLRELRGLVRQLGLSENVRFLGGLERSAALDVIETLRVLVVPSRWQEPSGTVASEAAALGTPIVAARSGGMPEYVPEGVCALYFDIDDVDGCARALATTLHNGEETARRVARARARATELLTVAREVEAMRDFVQDAASGESRRP